ncbi:MAG TPA: M28 family metallopeptidase [Thermoanaerobaculia bacterium]|nr:M28 family metallopeptidase [Thermoanaerobaculia bacterium]
MTSSSRFGAFAAVFGLLSGLPLAAFPALATPSAHEVASGLASLGPRADQAAGHRAVDYLLAALRRAGLASVQAVPAREGGFVNVEAVVPGQTADEIVLSAHYDSVSGSPGAGDDASGCGVAIAAAADLRRTPLRHTVRVVLFDREEEGLRGSEAWLRERSPEARRQILADLNLEMLGWSGSAGPIIHVFPAWIRSGERPNRVMPPGWLVHAVERAGESVGWSYTLADHRFSLPAQFLLRSVDVRLGSDSDSFLRHGIPAVTVSDSSLLRLDPAYHRPADVAARLDARRLESWTLATAAAVRRLDALAGRPLFEDQYLDLFGHVWLRRDLIWIGFLLWMLLVLRGRPGRWRGATADERRRQMRSYLPGFLFRGLLVLAIFLAPVFAVLLWPAALLALAPPRSWGWKALWIVLGCLPLIALMATVGVAISHELVQTSHGFQGGTLAEVLIPAALAAFVISVGSRRDPFLQGSGPKEPVPQARSGDPAR